MTTQQKALAIAVAGVAALLYFATKKKSKKRGVPARRESRPWDAWPQELPIAAEGPEVDTFRKLNDVNFHAQLHEELRARALAYLREKLPSTERAAVLLAGGTSLEFQLYDTDVDKCEFRQEAFFSYLFQINEPDCFGVLDLEREETLLFVPRVTDDMQRWTGSRIPLEVYNARYRVNATYYNTQVIEVLRARGFETLYLLEGVNTDSGTATTTLKQVQELEGINDFKLDRQHLHPLLVDLRLRKSPGERELLRLSAIVNSQAHVYVMRHVKPGMPELQLEALFKSWILYYSGARHCAYTCICGSGPNGSVLHYGHAGRPNDRFLKDGDTVVCDMGGDWHGYAQDMTRTYPVNGKFTRDQRAIYEAVREAQQAVISALKPGVNWAEMHRLAERVIIRHLIHIGILHNGTVEDMEAAYIGSVFMPHGLGHLLGMLVHDVGGYPNGTSRASEPGLCWLRMGRPVEEDMYLTVEPGVYFNDPTLDKALNNPHQARYINTEVLQRFRGSGGCRLEDDVMITATGCENYSVLPTSVEDVEDVILSAQQQQ